MTPYFGAGGNRSVSAGATWTRLSARELPCRQVKICADATVDLVFRTAESGDDSVALTVFAGSYYTVFGIADARDVWVKRKDNGANVTIPYRWEAP